MTHDSSDDNGAPYHSMILHRMFSGHGWRTGHSYTLFVVPENMPIFRRNAM